ncbi:phenylalanine--tRNA ligase, beta subunit [Gleimia coleocanis DSM 15436]|uniref:Phenylalanine--tRNA ligase beta subunit n=1 Tax=Gleimia coleocanis DSM 15436 TaxID=525245 RepID=C0W1E4_9ACTO|nr:phenylalanine--tRNA ligase subunit beta [Gleimia coleocanis]EEH63517.1 phenylalanine--tRNA ligase, beta subunit [Gleimia coleocanis DSM 15436]
MPNVPISWLKDHVEVLPGTNPEQLAADLVKVGLEEETIHPAKVKGPLVVGRVLTMQPEKQSNGKTINYCRVDVGVHNDAPGTGKEPSDLPSRSIICGAHNFKPGDLVVVILPGGVLPGNFEIATRKTYGHISDGMICSERELGFSDEHNGIIVLNEKFAEDELPGIGEDLIEFLGLGQELLEINVTPDRGYCFSMRGIAREYSHSTGAKFTDPGLAKNYAGEIPEANEAGFEVIVDDQAPIRGNVGCDRFVTRIVRGINPAAPTPKWMVERLEAMGMRSISLAVDATNYVMLDLGQPLHAYDLNQVTAPIVVRRALENEKLTTLDDVERNLDPQDLVITDSANGTGSRVLGIAGVMGGATTEVTEETQDVLIEAAHFDSVSVARSARRHRIPSEAAKRFERGVDPLLPAVAAQKVVDILVEYGGGTVDSAVSDLNNVGEKTQILMPASEPARLTGVEYPAERVVEILETIGCQVETQGENLLVTAPTWRPDITEACDLVEEVARLDGYDNIIPVLPTAPAGSGLPDRLASRRAIAQTLADCGFVEVLSYPFVGDAWDRCQIPENDVRRQAVRLRNPLVESQPFLRTSVLDSLLDIAQRNAARGAESIRVFELGMVTLPQGVKPAGIPSAAQRPHPKEIGELHRGTPKQPWHLGMVLGGSAVANNVRVGKRVFDWADVLEGAHAVAAAVGVKLEVAALYRESAEAGVPKPVATPADAAPWHPGRAAVLFVRDGKRIVEVGRAGELHPRVVKTYGLPARSVAMELDLEALLKLAPKNPIQVQPVSTYPVVKEDIAVVVDDSIPVAALLAEIKAAGGELLEQIALFDEYVGSQIDEGKRSLAFALRMRAADRTLAADETARVRSEIMALLEKKFSAKLRG